MNYVFFEMKKTYQDNSVKFEFQNCICVINVNLNVNSDPKLLRVDFEMVTSPNIDKRVISSDPSITIHTKFI